MIMKVMRWMLTVMLIMKWSYQAAIVWRREEELFSNNNYTRNNNIVGIHRRPITTKSVHPKTSLHIGHHQQILQGGRDV
ncbi:uncharacterized protein LOC105215939 isoform X3 [Zeugodacus cucurbitae]|uniref:uncharacterized protein LOC105215939 isoform X3 n=1 Tax=Zeugodacus cucurbitae TaxID=28588 RepID=UPI0023D967F4|nr:uncharacterized protein LOC105215939 isoform X3 [Zeugodacus cucurbitae]